LDGQTELSYRNDIEEGDEADEAAVAENGQASELELAEA
jgi:hypothetical protein